MEELPPQWYESRIGLRASALAPRAGDPDPHENRSEHGHAFGNDSNMSDDDDDVAFVFVFFAPAGAARCAAFRVDDIRNKNT
jgi:hypothetical protein